MKTNIAIALLALVSLFSCRTADITVDPSLHAEAMPVKGRNGLLIGQVIRYGEFKTDPVRRGWTKGYDIPFVLRFQGAKEKLSFTQHGPAGVQAEVACISKFKSTEIELVRDFFGIPIEQNTGNIRRAALRWDILHNPTRSARSAPVGILSSTTPTAISCVRKPPPALPKTEINVSTSRRSGA